MNGRSRSHADGNGRDESLPYILPQDARHGAREHAPIAWRKHTTLVDDVRGRFDASSKGIGPRNLPNKSHFFRGVVQLYVDGLV